MLIQSDQNGVFKYCILFIVFCTITWLSIDITLWYFTGVAHDRRGVPIDFDFNRSVKFGVWTLHCFYTLTPLPFDIQYFMHMFPTTGGETLLTLVKKYRFCTITLLFFDKHWWYFMWCQWSGDPFPFRYPNVKFRDWTLQLFVHHKSITFIQRWYFTHERGRAQIDFWVKRSSIFA